MKIHVSMRIWTKFLLVGFGVLVAAGAYRAAAGPGPMPLEPDLDLAKLVVVGSITHIEAAEVQWDAGVHVGLATVAVKETLKGAPSSATKFLVVTRVDPNYVRSRILCVRRVGDSGIWVIGSNAAVEHTDVGLVPEERKADIQGMPKALGERRWSAPVNGLRAWAGVVHQGYFRKPVIIFAVNNVTAADIFLPVAHQVGLVTATVTDQDGRASEYVLGNAGKDDKTVFCQKLSPGETAYLHPDYSFIDLAWRQNVPAGKYRVVVTCENAREGMVAKGSVETAPVAAWKGKLQAASVELVLGAEDSKQQDAQGGPGPR